MTTIILYQECSYCGKKLDRAKGYKHDEKPNPGDVTVCSDCGGINEYDKDLSLIPVSELRIKDDDMADARQLRRMVRALRF